MLRGFPRRRSCLLALCATSLLSAGPARAIVQLLVQQVGADVVITGSGSANTTDLTISRNESSWTNVLTDTQIYAGPDAFGSANVDLWGDLSLTGPLVFGSDPTVIVGPSSGSGDLFGIFADNGSSPSLLVLPFAYSSGASLSGTTTFTGTTLAQLGLIGGQVSTWTWGSGANADSLRLEVAVPAPLPIAGAAVAFRQARRLRRRCRLSRP